MWGPRAPRRVRPPVPALVLALLVAGCAAPAGEDHTGHDEPRWTFTQRLGEETPASLGEAPAFEVTRDLRAAGGMRQIGGQWHSGVAADETFVLRMDADVDITVSFRLSDASGAATSGTCDWGDRWDAEKEVALGRARMRNNATSCEIQFTPGIAMQEDDGPTLRWEARSAASHAEGWGLRFVATRG